MPSLMHGESLIYAPQTPPASSVHFLQQWQGRDEAGEGLRNEYVECHAWPLLWMLCQLMHRHAAGAHRVSLKPTARQCRGDGERLALRHSIKMCTRARQSLSLKCQPQAVYVWNSYS